MKFRGMLRMARLLQSVGFSRYRIVSYMRWLESLGANWEALC